MITDLIELPAEERVRAVIEHAFGGVHHVEKFTKHEVESAKDYAYWTCQIYGCLGTWDFGQLSYLVVASLGYGVRVELRPHGPRYLKLILHPRHKREGNMSERIPGLEHMVTRFDKAERLKGANLKETT